MSFAVLADGTLGILGADVDLKHEWRRDASGLHVGDPERVAAAALARLWTFNGTAMNDGPTFPLLTPYPIFDRFPDGRWVVASARADEDANCRILTTEGDEVRRIRIGDGIEHLKTGDGSRIWVGWFDEGVFGNDRWRIDGHEWPPNSYGLAAFDEHGTLLAHAAGAPSGSEIADCYALNVINQTAWACTYPAFPILACGLGSRSRWWPTTLNGPCAIVVSAPYLLAAGGYAKDGDRVALLRLDQKRGATVQEWRLPFNVGFPVAVDLVDGRGDVLHAVHDGAWHRWRIGDFVADSLSAS